MKRFFQKSVALFLLCAAIGIGFSSALTAHAQQSAAPVAPTYTCVEVVSIGSYTSTTTQVVKYVGGGNWQPINASGALNSQVSGNNWQNDSLTSSCTPPFNLNSIDPNSGSSQQTYAAEEAAWDKWSNSSAGNQASQAQENANAANAGDWYYYLKNAGAILVQPVLIAIYLILQILLIPLTSFFLTIAGNLVDIAIKFSILGIGYGSFSSMVQSIWTIARDTCNVAFIFLLLYIAIETIIGAAGSKAKGMIVSIVISALFINFSLFLTQLVVDGGNLVATSLLGQISSMSIPAPVSGPIGGAITSGITGVANTATSVATGGANANDPQISTRIMDGLGLETVFQTSGSTPSLLQITSSSLIASTLEWILFLVTLYAFIVMAILLISRFVMIVFLMATSPLGFMGGMGLSFLDSASGQWRKEFTNQVLIAPVFAFFMLVVLKVAQVVNLTSASTASSLLNSNTTAAHLLVYFDYVFIIYLIIRSVSITKGLSKTFGGLADKAASAVTGLAFGAATGGTALLARQTIGRGAAALANSEGLRNQASKRGLGGIGARLALRASTGVSRSALDVRNTNEAKEVLGFMKGEGMNIAGEHAKGGKEGFIQTREAFAKSQTEFAKNQLSRNNLTEEQAIAEFKEKNKDLDAKEAEIKQKLEAAQKAGDTGETLKQQKELGDILGKQKTLQNLDKVGRLGELTGKENEKERKDILASVKQVTEERKKAYQEQYAQTVEKSVPAWIETHLGGGKNISYAKAAADKIRKDLVKEKTKEQKLSDIVKEFEGKEKEEKKPEGGEGGEKSGGEQKPEGGEKKEK